MFWPNTYKTRASLLLRNLDMKDNLDHVKEEKPSAEVWHHLKSVVRPAVACVTDDKNDG